MKGALQGPPLITAPTSLIPGHVPAISPFSLPKSACTGDGRIFAAALLGVHAGVACYTETNFWGAHIPVPTNLNLGSWAALCVTDQDHLILQYLQSGLPAGYEGPAPTPTFHNHPSTVHHGSDMTAYIIKELKEGAMVGPFDHPPFTPWPQTKPLLTRNKKNSHFP